MEDYENLYVLSLRYLLSIFFEGKFYGMRACMHIDAFTGDLVRLDLFSRLYMNMAIKFDVPRRYFIGSCLFTFFESDNFDC